VGDEMGPRGMALLHLVSLTAHFDKSHQQKWRRHHHHEDQQQQKADLKKFANGGSHDF